MRVSGSAGSPHCERGPVSLKGQTSVSPHKDKSHFYRHTVQCPFEETSLQYILKYARILGRCGSLGCLDLNNFKQKLIYLAACVLTLSLVIPVIRRATLVF